jgi:hypothetical protein
MRVLSALQLPDVVITKASKQAKFNTLVCRPKCLCLTCTTDGQLFEQDLQPHMSRKEHTVFVSSMDIMKTESKFGSEDGLTRLHADER